MKRKKKVKSQEELLKVIGAVQFISQEEYDKHGHLKDIEQHPVLVYSESDWTNKCFWKYDEYTLEPQFMLIYDYMIEKKYTIEEAQVAFPELFL